jgi:hypothetical protein
VAAITLSHLWTNDGYEGAALVEGFGGRQRADYLSENTEDDLKILLRILSIQNYFRHTYTGQGQIFFDSSIHQPSSHSSGLSRVLAICFSNWQSTI